MQGHHMTLKPAGEFDIIFRYATEPEMVTALEFVMRQSETESVLFKVRSGGSGLMGTGREAKRRPPPTHSEKKTKKKSLGGNLLSFFFLLRGWNMRHDRRERLFPPTLSALRPPSPPLQSREPPRTARVVESIPFGLTEYTHTTGRQKLELRRDAAIHTVEKKKT